MKKCYDFKDYQNTIAENEQFFRAYYFHSIIDLNLVKLDSILKYGILSRHEIERLKLISFYTHDISDYNCKNGLEYISLVDYDKLLKIEPLKNQSLNNLFDAFALHTLTSLSLLVDKNITTIKNDSLISYFDDEVFAYDKIDKSHLKGILLPNYLASKELKDIPFLPNDPHSYTLESINHLLDFLDNYFNTSIDRTKLLNATAEAWHIANEFSRPVISSALEIQKTRYGIDMLDVLSSLMQELWSCKTKISYPTYIDIIKYLNHDELPIYEVVEMKLTKHLYLK